MRNVNWYLLSGIFFIIAAVINILSSSGNSGNGAILLLAGVIMIFAGYNFSKRNK